MMCIMFKPKSPVPLVKRVAKEPEPPLRNNEPVDRPESFADQVNFTSDQSSDDDDSETEDDLDASDKTKTASCNRMPFAPPPQKAEIAGFA